MTSEKEITYEDAVSSFIENKQYLNNPDVLGIVLYGSYVTGFAHSKSDVDLHVIMSDNVKQLVRGTTIHKGYKIEYFEKPLHDLYESAYNDFLTQNNALVPIIGEGLILFDRYGDTKTLQDHIKTKYAAPLPPLSGDDAKEMAAIIFNRITQLEVMLATQRPDFNHNYHLVVEKIRKFYSRISGCPDIPVAKAYRIYTDAEYGASFCKSHIPDPDFLEKYLSAIQFNGSDEEKMGVIYDLYDYTTKDLEFNPNNYRILIKSRNNPLNKNHETF